MTNNCFGILCIVHSPVQEDARRKRPPANCEELNFLGQTVNGLYLVKKKKEQETLIEVVYCDFDPTSKIFYQDSSLGMPVIFCYSFQNLDSSD